jgi:hypothetical protein
MRLHAPPGVPARSTLRESESGPLLPFGYFSWPSRKSDQPPVCHRERNPRERGKEKNHISRNCNIMHCIRPHLSTPSAFGLRINFLSALFIGMLRFMLLGGIGDSNQRA